MALPPIPLYSALAGDANAAYGRCLPACVERMVLGAAGEEEEAAVARPHRGCSL